MSLKMKQYLLHKNNAYFAVSDKVMWSDVGRIYDHLPCNSETVVRINTILRKKKSNEFWVFFWPFTCQHYTCQSFDINLFNSTNLKKIRTKPGTNQERRPGSLNQKLLCQGFIFCRIDPEYSLEMAFEFSVIWQYNLRLPIPKYVPFSNMSCKQFDKIHPSVCQV